jgi:hypothetical protein
MENMTDKFVDRIKSEKEPKEGELTKAVESVTAQAPSITWLMLAFGSMAVSAGLAMSRNRKGLANFVGLWVPTLLIMGLYNKLVKVQGSDQATKGTTQSFAA